MISSTITIACAIAALFLTRLSRKPLTRYVTIILSMSSIIYLDRFIGLASYGYLIFAFASILASVEPNNSLNLKVRHKTFFLIMGIVVVLLAAANFLKFEQYIPEYILGICYCVALALFLLTDKKKRFKSRYGILVVWMGTAIKWILTIL